MFVSYHIYEVKYKFHPRDEAHLSSVIEKGCIKISPHPPLRGTLSGLGEGYVVRLINYVINNLHTINDFSPMGCGEYTFRNQ